MEPIAYHLTIRLQGDRVLAPSAGARRVAATCVVGAGRPARMLVFRIADTHLHAVLACTRREAGTFTRSLVTRWHRHLGPATSFEPARLRPILDQRHLYSATRYVLRQEEHHEIDVDPLHDGSNLPDLLGARVLFSDSARLVREHLPRFDPTEYLPELAPVEVELGLLSDAAAGAFALAELVGNTPVVVAARHAAAWAARDLRAEDVAEVLGLHPRSIRRLLSRPCPAEHLRAVILQMQWRAAIARARTDASGGATRVR